jgi:hypothetical protein
MYVYWPGAWRALIQSESIGPAVLFISLGTSGCYDVGQLVDLQWRANAQCRHERIDPVSRQGRPNVPKTEIHELLRSNCVSYFHCARTRDLTSRVHLMLRSVK